MTVNYLCTRPRVEILHNSFIELPYPYLSGVGKELHHNSRIPSGQWALNKFVAPTTSQQHSDTNSSTPDKASMRVRAIDACHNSLESE